MSYPRNYLKKKKQTAKKLHCQFGHSSTDTLLKSANIWDQELDRETDTV